MNELKIEKFDPIKEMENAQLNQRRMILKLYETETWALIENTMKQLERNFRDEKQKIIKGMAVEVKDRVLYVEGKQDCIAEVFDAIQKIVADGETILKKNEMLKGLEEQ